MLGAKSDGGGVRRGGHGKAKSRSLTPLAKRASGFGMTIFRLGVAKGRIREPKPPATVRGRYICLRAIDARRGECYVAHEKPQVQKADPSYLRASLSYRDVRRRGWSVTDLSVTAIVVVRPQPGMAVPLAARAFFWGWRPPSPT